MVQSGGELVVVPPNTGQVEGNKHMTQKYPTCFMPQINWNGRWSPLQSWTKSLYVFFPTSKLRKCSRCVITRKTLKMCKTTHKHELQSDARFISCHMCICCLRCSLALNVPKWTSSYITQKCQAVYCLPLWSLSVPGLWHHSGVCQLYVIVSPPSLPAW